MWFFYETGGLSSRNGAKNQGQPSSLRHGKAALLERLGQPARPAPWLDCRKLALIQFAKRLGSRLDPVPCGTPPLRESGESRLRGRSGREYFRVRGPFRGCVPGWPHGADRTATRKD